MICSGGLSSSFHFFLSEAPTRSEQGCGLASVPKLPVRADATSAKFVVFLWPTCGGSVDFSSQAGLKKVTLGENLIAVNVCGHCRLRVKIGPDAQHQILFWGLTNLKELVIFTLLLSSVSLSICSLYFPSVCSVSLSLSIAYGAPLATAKSLSHCFSFFSNKALFYMWMFGYPVYYVF